MNHNEQELIQEYFLQKQKQSIHKNHTSRLLIGFAGVPGSGKSTIAKLLESRLNALRISTDDIRDYVRDNRNGQYPSSQKILDRVVDFISTYNGILIIDGSVDRTYKILSEITQKYNFGLYVISIQTDHQDSINRLVLRSSQEQESDLILALPGYEKDHEKFLNNYVPQIILQHPFESVVEVEKIISDITLL